MSAAESPVLSPPETPRRRPGALDRVLGLLGSYHIAVIVFLFLIVLTLMGTISQKTIGLYDSQRYYFESWIVPAEGRPWGIPLPGVALLLAVMFVNLLAGGILRVRKNWKTIGVIISHLSMLGLIAAGAVSLWYKKEGVMLLYEKGPTSNLVRANQDWVLEVREIGGTDRDVHVIHEQDFRTSDGSQTRTFFRSGWPFELKSSGYSRNAALTTSGDPRITASTRGIDGFCLVPLPPNPQNEANLAGLYLDVVDLAGKSVSSAVMGQIVSGGQIATPEDRPFTFESGGRQFAVSLARETWEVPFSLKLDDFIATYYPGTKKAKEYESNVVMTSEGKETKFRIWMNNPLRDSGYVAYQTSFDEQSPNGQERYSVLTVVKNPSDQWPLWCMIVSAIGLLIHFGIKLTRFITRRTPATPFPQS